MIKTSLQNLSKAAGQASSARAGDADTAMLQLSPAGTNWAESRTNADTYFHSQNENLGPQGRIPPTLTHVGAKLKPKWMRQVLVSGRAIRPYINTRMPQYGTENVEPLVPLFQELDELPPIDRAPIGDPSRPRSWGRSWLAAGD